MTDGRRQPPGTSDERAMLLAYLEYQRGTLALKCEGLGGDQLRVRSVPPSSLSLLGIVRHVAEVERSWFRQRVAGEVVGMRWIRDDDADAEFDHVDDADVREAFSAWQDERDRADRIIAARALDDTFEDTSRGVRSIRWLLLHMIEEYARHNGHADLLRERIDGVTGE